MMRMIASLALLPLLTFAACTTTDSAIQKNLAVACTGIEAAHAVFLEIAAKVNLKASTAQLEAGAHTDAVALCSNPGTDTAAVAVAVSKLGVQIGLAILEARGGHTSAAAALVVKHRHVKVGL